MKRWGLFFFFFLGIMVIRGEGEEKKIKTKEYSALQIKLQTALSGLTAEDEEEQMEAIEEIIQLAYQDKWGITSQAVPYILDLLEEAPPTGQFIFMEEEGKIKQVLIDGLRIQLIQALGAIGNKEAKPLLEKIAKSAPHFVTAELLRTEAGYASQALQSIEKKNEFQEKLKNMNEEEKINFLLSEIKKMEYLPANELLFINLISNYLTEIGKKAVPAMLNLLNEALDVDSGVYKGEVFYTSYVYLIIPRTLGNIGDKRAIPVLEKMVQIKSEAGFKDYALEAIGKIKRP
ncbi:MAG: hypothetical protein NC898_05285 [Candidatus Omnitrophica bacterium]|nr:hypothetical protein [Candidatus Omnitrophota bacterium]MCM8793856.1 hypothetical protein [Candidatus Omnitrophota bacterium]